MTLWRASWRRCRQRPKQQCQLCSSRSRALSLMRKTMLQTTWRCVLSMAECMRLYTILQDTLKDVFFLFMARATS